MHIDSRMIHVSRFKLFTCILIIAAVMMASCASPTPSAGDTTGIVQTTPAPEVACTPAPTVAPEVTGTPTMTATPESTPLPDESQPEIPSVNSYFEVRFLDVGQGDSTLVLCDDESMLIDGGDAGKSNLIFSYLKKNELDHLDYIVATHTHADHISGLAGALNYATVGNALCNTSEASTDGFANYVKFLAKQEKEITVPSVGDSFSLGSATVQVLAGHSDNADENNNCLVLKITYASTSFLFMADAETDEESSLLNADCNLNCTVLKVAHHGSSSSTSDAFLDAATPEYAVISVGKENRYQHPAEAVLERIKTHDIKLFRTDLQGDITCISNGSTVEITVSKNRTADVFLPPILPIVTPEPEITPVPEKDMPNEPNTVSYVLNTNTHKFHYPSCSSVGDMKEKNKKFYEGTREEVIAMGYDPCKRCKP